MPAEKVDKTKALILYICEKLKGERTFGAIVLNKVLYFVDNLWYQNNASTITGFKYVKQTNGPTPKPNQFLAIRQSLIDDKQLTIEPRKYFGRDQKFHRALKQPNISLFTADEISFIDEVINEFRDTNATIASLMTHELLAWKIARPTEELPFHTFLLSEADLTEHDIDWAIKSINEREAA